MGRYLLFTILCFGSLVAASQVVPDKASPFTAVKWEEDQPIVRFNGEWFHFEKLDQFGKDQLLDFCKKQFKSKWQKRFSEDLVEVLRELGYQPASSVALELRRDNISKNYIGTFTSENRHNILLFNKSTEGLNSASKIPKEISAAAAFADLRQFENMLTSVSSYSQISSFDYKSAITNLQSSICLEDNPVNVDWLKNEIGKIMSEIGDRHSSIKNESFNKQEHKTFSLRLPFGLSSLDGKIVGLKKIGGGENYEYYLQSHPYVQSINGISIDTLLDIYNYRDKRAPQTTRLFKGVAAIQKYGQLLFENNIECPDSVKVVFSNGNNEISKSLQLIEGNVGYSSKLLIEHDERQRKLNTGDFQNVSKILGSNIGYFNISEMSSYSEVEGIENFLEKAFKSFYNTKALIIDIRNNPGGVRDIIQTFARQIIQPQQSPWIGNVAYLRTDTAIVGEEDTMNDRYLHSYSFNKLSALDRKAIDDFTKHLQLPKTIDYLKFSKPFYMILHSGKQQYHQPIYLLVNEQSFSAASVFASVFKGLPNVSIVGETTDGSSGNSRTMYLKNSNIRVKMSTMLSFQRNGKTLDGNGTRPDIIIKADEHQILTGYDTQLNKLTEMINGI